MAEAGQDEAKQDKSEIPNTRIIQTALQNVSAGGNINVQINQNVHQNSSSSEPTLKPSTNMKQDMIRRKIAVLTREAETIQAQWESAISDEQREQLWCRLEQKQAQIAEEERKLG